MVDIGIKIAQFGAPPGGPGESREDLSLGYEVSLSNNDNAGVTSWNWELVSKPYTSSAVLNNTSLSTASFTPDVAGSYLIQLMLNGRVKQRVVAAVLTGRLGLRIPAAGESSEFVGGAFKAITDSLGSLETTIDASKLQGRDISSSAPSNSGQPLVWNNESSIWQPSDGLRANGIGYVGTKKLLINVPLTAGVNLTPYSTPPEAVRGWELTLSSPLTYWFSNSSYSSTPQLMFDISYLPYGCILQSVSIETSGEIGAQMTIDVYNKQTTWATDMTYGYVPTTTSFNNIVSTTITAGTATSSYKNVLISSGGQIFYGSEGILNSNIFSIILTAEMAKNLYIYNICLHLDNASVGTFFGPTPS